MVRRGGNWSVVAGSFGDMEGGKRATTSRGGSGRGDGVHREGGGKHGRDGGGLGLGVEFNSGEGSRIVPGSISNGEKNG